MTMNIPVEFEQFVEDQVALGNYPSAQEVIFDALGLLREQKLDALRSAIQVGIDQLDRGEGIDIEDEDALREFFDGIEAEGRQEIAAERAG